ncbi:sensor domain-containing protein [Neobacillus sp. LXY-1]|uniref:sensor domain-containing protein n=1 Tax=Neobacillus sp. LXY-1 TaxID=3379133 RepID=UPI003EDF6162
MFNSLQDPALLEDIYKSLFEQNPDPSFAVDLNGHFILLNEATLDVTGYSRDELLQRSFLSILNEDSISTAKSQLTESLNGQQKSYQVSIRHKNKHLIELQIITIPIHFMNQLAGIVGFAKEVTDNNKTKQHSVFNQSSLQNIINSIDVCLWSIDIQSKQILHMSQACEKIYGYTPKDYLENPFLWKQNIHPHDQALVEKMDKLLLGGDSIKFEYRIIDSKGDMKWIHELTIPVINDSGEVERVDGVTTDISQRKRAEEQLHFMAFYDSLTKLPNKRMLQSKLKDAIAKVKKTKKKIAVLHIDLDHFKLVNETLGFKNGDELIQTIAKRIRRGLSQSDFVSRHGADEFNVLLKNITDLSQVEIVAKNILQNIANPFYIHGREYPITASIGISIYSEHSRKPDHLLKQAATAMYQAKREGINHYKFYQEGMTESLTRLVELGHGLVNAINKSELQLYYQPIMNTQKGRITGFEALIRWFHPSMGFISPAEFIPIAEQTGQIIPIGEWVLRTACLHGKQIHESGYPETYISVNVSAPQFETNEFITKLTEILNETNFNPHCLKIEITESIMMKNMEAIAQKLLKLEEMGIEVLLDDFGTGYSSLSYLKRLPIKVLKIDQSFVQDIYTNPDQEAIVRTIVAMANSLRMDVIAEGVEQKNQKEFLHNLGCFRQQGYLYSRPVPFEDVLEIIGPVTT